LTVPLRGVGIQTMDERKEQSPDISDPKKLAAFFILQDLPKLKAAWRGASGVFFFGVLIGITTVWALNNSEMSYLRTVKADQQRDIDGLKQENLRLKTAIAEQTTPLYGRVEILANQLVQFADRYDTNHSIITFQQDYEARFEKRVFKIIDELDEAGFHSELVRTLLRSPTGPIDINANSVTNVYILAGELRTVGKSLKQQFLGSH
jgi:hypothetical protein